MKAKFRSKAQAKLQSLTELVRKEKSTQISHSLGYYLNDHFSSEVLLGGFIPFKTEVDWHLGFKRAREIALPKIVQERIDFVKTDIDCVFKNRGNFQVDSNLNHVVIPEVLLVPGLAFTRKRERLGRGGGYYDRYLKGFQGLKIGICFEEQLFDSLPMENWDQRVDLVITEKGKYNG